MNRPPDYWLCNVEPVEDWLIARLDVAAENRRAAASLGHYDPTTSPDGIVAEWAAPEAPWL